MIEEELAGAGWLAVDRVVRAHYRPRVSLNHGGAKRWQVCVFLIVFAYINIGEVARGFRPAVHSEMLRR